MRETVARATKRMQSWAALTRRTSRVIGIAKSRRYTSPVTLNRSFAQPHPAGRLEANQAVVRNVETGLAAKRAVSARPPCGETHCVEVNSHPRVLDGLLDEKPTLDGLDSRAHRDEQPAAP